MASVAILDCGAQYAKVIDRRVRELSIRSEILPLDTSAHKLTDFDAIIVSGGPHSVFDPKAPRCDPGIFKLGTPVLGICYGMQLMNYMLGGEVKPLSTKEYGETIIRTKPNFLFSAMSRKEQVLMSHSDSLTKLAPGFRVIATSRGIIAAIANDNEKLYGVQFHPEVDLTVNGKQILKNFLITISRLNPDFRMADRIQNAIEEIKSTVKNQKVLSLVSGGVDSAVTTALLLKTLPAENIYAIHVDSGFMRKDESKKVCSALTHLGLKNLDVVHAEKDFFDALIGVQNPQQKREIIGNLFMDIVDREIKRLKLPKNTFLAQGTLRPDLIESASSIVSSKADVIKTHHNDTRLVREKRKKGLVIETNKDWHKDEVRIVGRKLGLPPEIVERQPFPGPGLAIRILCAQSPYQKDIEKIQPQVQAIASQYGLNASILPIRSVGVQGDGRSYKYAVVLSGRGNFSILKKVASEIPKLVHEVNRVVYAFERTITSVHFTPTTLSKAVVEKLREADNIVSEVFSKYDVKNIAQCPVLLLPLSFQNKNKHSVVLRPFVTNDFMTGRTASFGTEIPIDCLKETVKRLYIVEGIDSVMYDLTSKPPSTTEWE